MTRNSLLLATGLIGTVLAGPVLAQATTPTVSAPTIITTTTPATVTVRAALADPMKIDTHALQSGMRTSKVVGMTVVNSNNDTLGTIDDLIVMPNETVPYAVLSVGGFLGMGAHYVVVPYGLLEPTDKKQMRLPNATKDSLKALPSFAYPA